MRVNCILRSGLLFVTLSLTIAKRKQSSFAASCYPRGTLSQAVDTLYAKAARLKATIPEDHIKNVRLLKKKTKKLFMKNCRFQEQLLSFFMEDVFGQLQLQVCKEIHFVEDFHSLRKKLSRCLIRSLSSPVRVFTVKRPEEENNVLKDLILGKDAFPRIIQSQEHIQRCKRCMNSVETVLQILKFGLFLDWRCVVRPCLLTTGSGSEPRLPVCHGMMRISCASSAREMKSITRMKRKFHEIGKKGIYKAISELDILLSWIKQFLESIK